MSIVLNELTWAEDALRCKKLGSRPFETLTRLAKYYTYHGATKRVTRQKLDEFLLACDPTASTVAWSATLDRAAKYAAKHPPVVIDGVDVSATELEKIDALSGTQVRRLAFTLLCVAKYMYAVSQSTSYWVSISDSDTMNMANINTSVKRQSAMYAKLREAGLIRFSRKVDNLSVQVLFVDDGDPVLHINDFRNLGYQYLRYRGEPYYVCQNCGIVYKRSVKEGGRGRPSKYCQDCAVKLRIKSRVDSVMRSRGKLR